MLLIFIRSVITFIVILIVMRMLGKRQLGEMQPFELVVTLVISELACIPMADTSIPLLYGVVAIFTLFAAHQLVALLSRKSLFVRKIVCGRPTILITPEGIDFRQLKNLNMSISDLLEAVRTAGYFSFDQIEYAIIETNGKMSVMQSNDKAANNMTELPLTLIEDGKIIKSTLLTLDLTVNWLYALLNKLDVPKLRDVNVATINSKGRLYLQHKHSKPIVKEKVI